MATNWLEMAKEAYDSATSYIDSNNRAEWDFSIKAFRNEHSSGSKYLSPDYAHRSRLFRPKARSAIRKNEAAAAVALFSNMDVVNMTPGNPDDLMSVASSECMKELVEYRLTKTIPAFPLVMGGVQDAQKQGMVCSYNYWKYQKGKDGRKLFDKPCIELRPIENLRFDPASDWIDPVGSSPYFCDIVPMFVCDVKAMMNAVDDKTDQPKWKKLEDSVILRATPNEMDSTRRARMGEKSDPYLEKKTEKLKNFDVVWVMRWFMRDSQGEEQTFYTMGTEDLLTDAKPIDEVYFHGKRPYTMGYAILETHLALKPSLPTILKPLIQETNEIANQRLDNVKFVLNKRWIVRRGAQVDVPSLVRNVPGGVTLVNNPKEDVQESNWADVTSSSYVEQDRLNADFDDLAGNFSPNTKFANKGMNDTLGGSRMAAQGAGIMTDYLLRTIIETWWEPTLRQLVLLESYYETDENVLALCANKARLFPRFGISRITDEMLMNETNVTVNGGMGSSNPNERFQKFMMATGAAIQLATTAPPGFNVKEGIKEIYSNAGYRDGARFFDEKVDPQKQKLMQMVQQAKQIIDGKKIEQQAQMQLEVAKIQSNEKINGAKIQVDQARIQGDLRIRAAELEIEKARLELERMKLSVENDPQVKQTEYMAAIAQAQQKLEELAMKLKIEREKHEMDKEAHVMELQTLMVEQQMKQAEATGKVMPIVQQITDQTNRNVTQKMSGELTSLRDDVGKALSALAAKQTAMEADAKKPRPPRKYSVEKRGGKFEVMST